ncbi:MULTISPECIES: H-NS histone family protein [Burkholderia]|uniref:H-NS histone family protein n=1 Tax=Burkholderia TaxID=32008 RepID=UPI001E63920B|nr:MULTISPECIES: H-NS histone family protein [Burkholderia]
MNILSVRLFATSGGELAVHMENYRQYLKVRARLEEQLKIERDKVIHSIVAEIRDCVRIFGLAVADIFPDEAMRDSSTRRMKRRPAKYFDPVSGATWSGVGREPIWIRGRNREEFSINRFVSQGENLPFDGEKDDR